MLHKGHMLLTVTLTKGPVSLTKINHTQEHNSE